jgi:hypothetical protein
MEFSSDSTNFEWSVGMSTVNEVIVADLLGLMKTKYRKGLLGYFMIKEVLRRLECLERLIRSQRSPSIDCLFKYCHRYYLNQ